MPQPPIAITLTDGQKIEALKRVREGYQEELAKVEAELTEILTACAEADFLAQYLGEQPEVKDLRVRKPDAEAKERRRQYLIQIIERLDQIIPKQPELKPALAGAAKPGGLKRF